jgi:hypothetical protein
MRKKKNPQLKTLGGEAGIPRLPPPHLFSSPFLSPPFPYLLSLLSSNLTICTARDDTPASVCDNHHGIRLYCSLARADQLIVASTSTDKLEYHTQPRA